MYQSFMHILIGARKASRSLKQWCHVLFPAYCVGPTQGDILRRLSNVPNVVRLLAAGPLAAFGKIWHAVLVSPVGRHLEATDDLCLVAKVAYDIAGAINQCAERDIAHRDITANNIIEYKGDGVLLDFSAAKVGLEAIILTLHTTFPSQRAVDTIHLS